MYDAVVIGAGPGGAVCARELALFGHNVVLVEKGTRGRNRPSAGGIPPRNSIITPMKDSLVRRTVDSGFFCTAKESTFTITAPDDLGHIVYRSDFDLYLQDLAVDAGAEIVYDSTVEEISFHEDRVAVSAGGKNRQIYDARVVVGAFGAGPAELLEAFGAEPPESFNSVMIEAAVPAEQIDERIGSSAESYTDSRITKTGRIWIYPKKDSVAVGINSLRDGDIRKKLMGFMNEHPIASKKLEGWKPYYGTLEESTFSNLIPRRPVRRSYGDRFVLVGDAAGAADPLTGEGIYHAQRTGQIASMVLNKCLKNDSLDADSLAEYQSRWHRAVVHCDTCYNLKSANILFDCPHQDDVMEALLHAAQDNERVREAVLWVFAGLRSQREAMLHVASPRLIFQIVKKLSVRKSFTMIPRIIKTYSLGDLL